MLVRRWQAPLLPTIEQMKMIFEAEGLEFVEEHFPSKSKVTEHRHPFDEVRMIFSGRMLFNINGNKLLLYPGDRIEIPANTKHDFSIEGDQESVSLYANKPF